MRTATDTSVIVSALIEEIRFAQADRWFTARSGA
jgi:hypothetical protein